MNGRLCLLISADRAQLIRWLENRNAKLYDTLMYMTFLSINIAASRFRTRGVKDTHFIVPRLSSQTPIELNRKDLKQIPYCRSFGINGKITEELVFGFSLPHPTWPVFK